MKKILFLLALLIACISPGFAQKPTALNKAKPQVVETKAGFEFKNLKMSKEDEAALAAIYKDKKTGYRVSRVKNNKVVETYGNANVQNVSIISSTHNGGNPEAKVNWIVNKTVDSRWVDEQCITYITAGLGADQIAKIRMILSKYDSSLKGK